MEGLESRERFKSRKSAGNFWSGVRIFIRAGLLKSRKSQRFHHLENLKILNVGVMQTGLYASYDEERKAEKIAYDEQEHVASVGRYYKTTDRTTSNYRNHDPHVPYSVNTLHLQNPYKASQKLEGYASRDTALNRTIMSKEMFRPRESTVRSRYNKTSMVRRERVPTKKYDREDDGGKIESSNVTDIRSCLKNSQITAMAQQYCVNSSLHGLRYVGDPTLSLGERLFWIVSFIVAVLTASYYIWLLYKKWVLSPIIISLDPESVPLNYFPFPSITICNMNNAKKTEAHRILRGNNISEKLLLEDICNAETNASAFDAVENEIKWESMLSFMINVSQPCTDMLYSCKWHGNQTECEKIFNPSMTDEGICCNFNSVEKKYLFYNPLEWPELNITFPFAGIDWNPESGYDITVPSDATPWRSYGAGLTYGLTLILDAEISEYYCSSTASAGFKMLLHNPVETPKMADFSFAVTPGEETRVVVTPRISTASRAILSVPLKIRKCFFLSERKLRYYRTYTQRNCVLECEANFTQKICHCVQYYMPKSPNTPICGKKDDQCATNARRVMELKLYDEDDPMAILNISHTPSCNCWPGCYEINYNMEISQSKLVPSFRIRDQYIKKNSKYFTENMAVVHLFFVESQFTKYVKNELFGFTEFLSSTGGLLGLFMGFSFLSFMEVAYFATLRFWCRLYEGRAKSERAVLQVQPMDRTQNVIYPFAQ